MRESKFFPCTRKRISRDSRVVQLAVDGCTPPSTAVCCEPLPVALQSNERRSFSEQEHGAQLHSSAPLGRHPVLSCLFAIWMGMQWCCCGGC